jgi:hypothetical protein
MNPSDAACRTNTRSTVLGFPNLMVRKAGILLVAGALGAASAFGAAACGEERGDVQIEGGTTGTGTSKTERTTTTN